MVLLLEHGADAARKSDEDRTAHDLICEGGERHAAFPALSNLLRGPMAGPFNVQGQGRGAAAA